MHADDVSHIHGVLLHKRLGADWNDILLTKCYLKMLSKDAKRFKYALRIYRTEHEFSSLYEYYQITF